MYIYYFNAPRELRGEVILDYPDLGFHDVVPYSSFFVNRHYAYIEDVVGGVFLFDLTMLALLPGVLREPKPSQSLRKEPQPKSVRNVC